MRSCCVLCVVQTPTSIPHRGQPKSTEILMYISNSRFAFRTRVLVHKHTRARTHGIWSEWEKTKSSTKNKQRIANTLNSSKVKHYKISWLECYIGCCYCVVCLPTNHRFRRAYSTQLANMACAAHTKMCVCVRRMYTACCMHGV